MIYLIKRNYRKKNIKINKQQVIIAENEEEKEFLKQVLKFGNYKSGTENLVVQHVTKDGYYLNLNFSEFHCNSIYIDKMIYFRNLKENIKYTLSELGLEE